MKTNLYSLPITRSLNWDAMGHMSALISGARGTGKTFFAFSLIAALSTLPASKVHLLGSAELPTQVFVIDLKNADMARLSALLPKGRVANDKESAIEVVDRFRSLMDERMKWINNSTPFGSTAKTLQMPLFYLIIDEYSATSAAFNETVTKEDKSMKYHWFSTIHQILMLGRQLGFGVIIITQQASDVNSGLSTALKEEFGLKAHMGPANDASYRLTFGNEAEIPTQELSTGEGLIWLEGITDNGYLLPFAAPFVDTDNFWQILKSSFQYQDTEKYLNFCLQC